MISSPSGNLGYSLGWLYLSQSRISLSENVFDGVGSDGLVEIMLAGSEWSPYGFRFAPKGNEQVYATLQHFAAQGGMENTDTKMNQVAGRWFYFEAKRF